MTDLSQQMQMGMNQNDQQPRFPNPLSFNMQPDTASSHLQINLINSRLEEMTKRFVKLETMLYTKDSHTYESIQNLYTVLETLLQNDAIIQKELMSLRDVTLKVDVSRVHRTKKNNVNEVPRYRHSNNNLASRKNSIVSSNEQSVEPSTPDINPIPSKEISTEYEPSSTTDIPRVNEMPIENGPSSKIIDNPDIKMNEEDEEDAPLSRTAKSPSAQLVTSNESTKQNGNIRSDQVASQDVDNDRPLSQIRSSSNVNLAAQNINNGPSTVTGVPLSRNKPKSNVPKVLSPHKSSRSIQTKENSLNSQSSKTKSSSNVPILPIEKLTSKSPSKSAKNTLSKSSNSKSTKDNIKSKITEKVQKDTIDLTSDNYADNTKSLSAITNRKLDNKIKASRVHSDSKERYLIKITNLPKKLLHDTNKRISQSRSPTSNSENLRNETNTNDLIITSQSKATKSSPPKKKPIKKSKEIAYKPNKPTNADKHAAMRALFETFMQQRNIKRENLPGINGLLVVLYNIAGLPAPPKDDLVDEHEDIRIDPTKLTEYQSLMRDFITQNWEYIQTFSEDVDNTARTSIPPPTTPIRAPIVSTSKFPDESEIIDLDSPSSDEMFVVSPSKPNISIASNNATPSDNPLSSTKDGSANQNLSGVSQITPPTSISENKLTISSTTDQPASLGSSNKNNISTTSTTKIKATFIGPIAHPSPSEKDINTFTKVNNPTVFPTEAKINGLTPSSISENSNTREVNSNPKVVNAVFATPADDFNNTVKLKENANVSSPSKTSNTFASTTADANDISNSERIGNTVLSITPNTEKIDTPSMTNTTALSPTNITPLSTTNNGSMINVQTNNRTIISKPTQANEAVTSAQLELKEFISSSSAAVNNKLSSLKTFNDAVSASNDNTFLNIQNANYPPPLVVTIETNFDTPEQTGSNVPISESITEAGRSLATNGSISNPVPTLSKRVVDRSTTHTLGSMENTRDISIVSTDEQDEVNSTFIVNADNESDAMEGNEKMVKPINDSLVNNQGTMLKKDFKSSGSNIIGEKPNEERVTDEQITTKNISNRNTNMISSASPHKGENIHLTKEQQKALLRHSDGSDKSSLSKSNPTVQSDTRRVSTYDVVYNLGGAAVSRDIIMATINNDKDTSKEKNAVSTELIMKAISNATGVSNIQIPESTHINNDSSSSKSSEVEEEPIDRIKSPIDGIERSKETYSRIIADPIKTTSGVINVDTNQLTNRNITSDLVTSSTVSQSVSNISTKSKSETFTTQSNGGLNRVLDKNAESNVNLDDNQPNDITLPSLTDDYVLPIIPDSMKEHNNDVQKQDMNTNKSLVPNNRSLTEKVPATTGSISPYKRATVDSGKKHKKDPNISTVPSSFRRSTLDSDENSPKRKTSSISGDVSPSKKIATRSRSHSPYRASIITSNTNSPTRRASPYPNYVSPPRKMSPVSGIMSPYRKMCPSARNISPTRRSSPTAANVLSNLDRSKKVNSPDDIKFQSNPSTPKYQTTSIHKNQKHPYTSPIKQNPELDVLRRRRTSRIPAPSSQIPINAIFQKAMSYNLNGNSSTMSATRLSFKHGKSSYHKNDDTPGNIKKEENDGYDPLGVYTALYKKPLPAHINDKEILRTTAPAQKAKEIIDDYDPTKQIAGTKTLTLNDLVHPEDGKISKDEKEYIRNMNVLAMSQDDISKKIHSIGGVRYSNGVMWTKDSPPKGITLESYMEICFFKSLLGVEKEYQRLELDLPVEVVTEAKQILEYLEKTIMTKRFQKSLIFFFSEFIQKYSMVQSGLKINQSQTLFWKKEKSLILLVVFWRDITRSLRNIPEFTLFQALLELENYRIYSNLKISTLYRQIYQMKQFLTSCAGSSRTASWMYPAMGQLPQVGKLGVTKFNIFKKLEHILQVPTNYMGPRYSEIRVALTSTPIPTDDMVLSTDSDYID